MKRILFILILIISTLNVESAHIVGGEMTYKCLGGNQYEISLTVYRDCLGGGAPFDSPAFIGIFDGQGDTVTVLQVEWSDSVRIEIDTLGGCLEVPNNFCVEYAVYKEIITLPPSSGGYDIVYQRCCRNAAINNIIDPSTYGASFYAHIPDVGLAVCNNSPEFNIDPPSVICVNEFFNFDFSATDIDGDVLVYELCQSINGAECIIPGDINGGYCDIVPPPYDEILYFDPFYSIDNILGYEDYPLEINPQTGVLTGFSDRLGKYVVSICVSEYRNGQLLNTLTLDFQFDVTVCNKAITAAVDFVAVEYVDNEPYYVINACKNDKSITLSNNSVGSNDFEWQVFDNGSLFFTSTDVEPMITFPRFDQYEYQLIAGIGKDCADTIKGFINIIEEIEADFDYEIIECANADVAFTNTSNEANLTTFSWDFGDGINSGIENPSHLYNTTDSFQVVFFIENDNGCTARDTQIVFYQIKDLEGDFIYEIPAPSENPFNVIFTNQSNKGQVLYWSFGDGNTSTDNNPNYTYSDTGLYIVTLIIEENGCTDTVSQQVHIEPKFAYHLPNAFTPNNDGQNDLFIGKGYKTNIAEFDMQIWDRWGKLIFQTNDPNIGWNGFVGNNGKQASNGVYTCFITLKDVHGKAYNYQTFATLIR